MRKLTDAKPKPEEAIADYLAAWSESGGEPPFKVVYERGWVRWRYGSYEGSKVRIAELVEMTKRIRARNSSTPAGREALATHQEDGDVER